MCDLYTTQVQERLHTNLIYWENIQNQAVFSRYSTKLCKALAL